MGVEVFLDDVVITEVKSNVKVWCEIEGTARDRDVNVMIVDGLLVKGLYVVKIFSKWRREENSCTQCRIPL